MTDPAPTTTTPTDADDRGRLDVRVKAVQHIVEKIALDVPGSTQHRTVLDKVRGAGAPHATVEMHGASASVHVDIAARWPARLSDIAADVRATVLREAPAMSGIDIRRCDVSIRAVGAADDDTPERRVQ